MLIITRKEQQKIYIGDEIAIVVLGTKNKQTKLGIVAPSKVKILREELKKPKFKIKVNNKSEFPPAISL